MKQFLFLRFFYHRTSPIHGKTFGAPIYPGSYKCDESVRCTLPIAKVKPVNFSEAAETVVHFFTQKRHDKTEIIFDRRGPRIILEASPLPHPPHFSLPAAFN